MDLITLYIGRNATPYTWSQFIKLIEDNLLGVHDFGRPVRGKYSINMSLCKTDSNINKLLNLRNKFNRLIQNASYHELTIEGKGFRYILGLPFLLDIAGAENRCDPDDPLVLKFLCKSYRVDEKASVVYL